MSTEPLLVNGWEVVGIRRAAKFFSALVELLPLPVNFCFEGTSISSEVRSLLIPNVVAATREIPTGTIWPKPAMFHVLATEEFIQQLGALADRRAEPEFCDHLHAYKDSHGLMQWYDAFDLPLLIDESITEAKVRSFCSKLGVQYAPWRVDKARRR